MKLVLHNDGRAWSYDGEDIHIGVADLPAAMRALRCLWSDHRDIVQLPSLVIECDDGVLPGSRAAVESRLAGFIHDLGNSAEDCWWGARNAIRNSVRVFAEHKSDALVGRAGFRPVVCVASGPSVREYMAAVRAAQSSGAVIVCADSIFLPLVRAGVSPDFVCVLERTPVFAPLVPPEACPSSVLVCPPVVDPSTVSGWDGRVCWFWQTVNDLYSWIGPDIVMSYSGRSAGTLAVAVSRLLGGSSIHLVGHDLCRIGGESHSPDVGAFTRDGQARAESDAAPYSMFSPVEVRCRDWKRRPSTRFWDLCRTDIEAMLHGCADPVYAVGLGGAAIDGSIPVAELSFCVGARASASPVVLGPVTPARYRSHLVRDVLSSIERARELLCRAAPTCPADALAAASALEPDAWASPEVSRLFRYVLAPVLNASSLRAHLRSADPSWPLLAYGVLRRGIPPILDAMRRDLESMHP